MGAPRHLPVIDVSPLLAGSSGPEARACVDEIDSACTEVGFFGVVGHGLDQSLFDRLDTASRAFFELPESVKAEIAMELAGPAWRGWFPIGAELTSGRPDLKEGVYFGIDHPATHPLVATGVALHGANQYPTNPPELGPTVAEWMSAVEPVARGILRGIGLALGRSPSWFDDNLVHDPTILFRIFHYPPATRGAQPATGGSEWGVAEHTDYGLLTLLAQDHQGGLEVQRLDGSWIAVDPIPGMIVCNLGDMLARFSGGRYRSTPHRVLNRSSESRLSFPYFFDPSWDAIVPGLDVTYGAYLTDKVSKVFPELFVTAVGPTPHWPTIAPPG